MTQRDRVVLMVIALLFLAGLAITGVGLYRTFQPAGPSTGENTFDGFYQYAFETSAFYPGADPCRTSLTTASATAYWLGAEPDSGFFDRLGELSPQAPPEWRYLDGAIVHVRFVGRLSPPGQYGHLGQYEREIIVVQLLEMSYPPTCR